MAPTESLLEYSSGSSGSGVLAMVARRRSDAVWEEADEVAAEQANSLKAVNLNFSNKGVSANGTDVVRVPIAPVATTGTYTPAMTTTAGTDKTATAVDVLIDNNLVTSWNLTGEDTLKSGIYQKRI
jgi:carbohydrate-binding DOMON domain-containing protein